MAYDAIYMTGGHGVCFDFPTSKRRDTVHPRTAVDGGRRRSTWGRDEPAPCGPLSPAEEAATFRLADERLTVELAAAEPQVDSPVALAWDADGRMYMAEMSD
jgi:hypothetical protein